jgi:molybdenum cofactor cytidylyltransferase
VKREVRVRAAPTRRPSVVLLAAGASTRFQGTKQLAQIRGKSLVETVLEAVPSDQVRETVVVLGHEAPAVAFQIEGKTGVRTVVNPGYRSGMGSSIKVGVSALPRGTRGVMVLLADQPFVTRGFLRRMLRAFVAGRGRRIVAASHNGVTTPPVVFPRRFFHELMELRGDQGAKSVIQRHSRAVSLVRVRSKKTLEDVDTREDLELALRSFEP